VLRNLTVNPKVVGGIHPEAAERGSLFYEEFLAAPVMNVGTLEAAEFVKLAGMVYRDVNIGLANQLAEYAEVVGLDLTALRAAINSDDEAAVLTPGIGVGGHCTPVYPYFYIRDAERHGIDASLAEQARSVNDGQAKRSLDRVEAKWGSLRDQEVLLLGLGFRPEVKEDAFSTTYLLHSELLRRDARPLVHDTMFSADEIGARGFTPAVLDAHQLPPVVVLVTAHTDYMKLTFDDLAARGVKVVVDGRNVWDGAQARDAGLVYIGIGRGEDPELTRVAP
jgi:nucleotide sugar dehydrogenase